MHWRKMKSPLSGNELQQLGYKPGKQYKEMLNDLHCLFLDGKINNEEEAKKFILQKYPLS
jgi:tRNA nucleotidyltransferase (CCA-adding enzyme)